MTSRPLASWVKQHKKIGWQRRSGGAEMTVVRYAVGLIATAAVVMALRRSPPAQTTAPGCGA